MNYTFTKADLILSKALDDTFSVQDGVICDTEQKNSFDLSGYMILPGIIDLHGDGFERHLAPRRGAVKNIQEGLRATHAELAANGITTAVLAQFYSWEGGMRGPEFATQFFETLQAFAPSVPSTLLPQLRFETYMYAHYDNIVALCPKYDIPYLVFNDHLPHKELAAGKRPPRLTGQALKAHRSPDAHHAYLRELHEASDRVQKHLPDLIKALGDTILLGSHDNASAKEHATWAERGISICEFPETQEAAEQAHQRGNCVVMGAPNVLRGGSHKKNVGAKLLIENHLCDALASDYHYPAQRLAAFQLAPQIGLEAAWALISANPARILGLEDRGTLYCGKRADFIVVNKKTQGIEGTFAQGDPTYLTGELAKRLLLS